jgi:hypothetical protein
MDPIISRIFRLRVTQMIFLCTFACHTGNSIGLDLAYTACLGERNQNTCVSLGLCPPPRSPCRMSSTVPPGLFRLSNLSIAAPLLSPCCLVSLRFFSTHLAIFFQWSTESFLHDLPKFPFCCFSSQSSSTALSGFFLCRYSTSEAPL